MFELVQPVTPEFVAKQTHINAGDSMDVYRLTDNPDRVLKVAKYPRHPYYSLAGAYAQEVAGLLMPTLFLPFYEASPNHVITDFVEGPVGQYNRTLGEGIIPEKYPPEILSFRSQLRELQTDSFLRAKGFKAHCLDFYGGIGMEIQNFEFVGGRITYLDSLEIFDRDATEKQQTEYSGSEPLGQTIDPKTGLSYWYGYIVSKPEESSSYESIQYEWSMFGDLDDLYMIACNNGGQEAGERLFEMHDGYLDNLGKVVQLGKF